MIQLIWGQSKKVIADSVKFNNYVKENSDSFVFDGQQPTGRGWQTLEHLFAENQFVAWGEYHNSALFSKLSNYALQSASLYGFRNWCVEVSPFVASELQRIAKSKNPLDSIKVISKDHPDYGTFPFFKTKEDIEMIATAEKYKYNIWGIDQEFQMAFPYCIGKAYSSLKPKIRKEYKAVHDSLLTKWWMPNVKLLDSLKNVTKLINLKQALEDIKISRTIYKNSDNLMRATLMKKNFYNYYDNVPSSNKKVFFKMGANHLTKGLNLMTHLYDLGNAAYELAQRNQTGFANVYFINRFYMENGEIIDDLQSDENEYPKEFLKLYDKNRWVVLDIRKLRGRFSNDKTLTDDTFKIIDKYDFIVVSPEIKK
ncbi:MAG: hypothetical protein DI529_06680 [Chryseobacterium sp.]|nr:MAG: hypothetical protein DI529_06680 [Chryseobacterium sp.]